MGTYRPALKAVNRAAAVTVEPSVDELIVDELRRFGPRTGAELMAAIDVPASDLIARATAMFVARIIGIDDTTGERRFTLRREVAR